MYKTEELWDMPLMAVEGEKHIPHLVGNLLYGLSFVVAKICFRYRIYGLEHLRNCQKQGGAVVVSTHFSNLDPVFLYLAARPKQWIRFLGKVELFNPKHPFLRRLVSNMGCIPVKRDTADRMAIKRAARMLKRGEIVGIFPEGTRRYKTSRPSELHAGASFIARMGGGAPMVPSTIRGVEKVKQKGKGLRFPRIEVAFGAPIALSEFDFLPKEDRLEGSTWYLMRECFALFYQCPACEVPMQELFPSSRDFSQEFDGREIARLDMSE